MDPEQTERFLEKVERIADALEAIATTVHTPPKDSAYQPSLQVEATTQKA